MLPIVFFLAVLSFPALCAESVTIDPTIAAQLGRIQPLTAPMVQAFVDAHQLTPAQAAVVKQYIGPDGKLSLPSSAIGPQGPVVRPAPSAPSTAAPVYHPAGAPVPAPSAADLGIGTQDRDMLVRMIREFRQGDRADIGIELRKFRPAVNKLIAESFPDPIDLPTKIALWEKVAGPANPDAAIGLCDTHREAMQLARPVLIPYAKDVGGALVRRKQDFGAGPVQRYFTSRELRNMVLDIEGLIAHCSGVSAAIFLMNIYGARYTEGEAPMRDDGRDWRRLVEACGGDPKHFDDDNPKTWDSRLSASERAAIGEHLIPYLFRRKDDCRRIARNGLSVCIGNVHHPDWDASRDEWERWWEAHGKTMQ
jgi:hypothetical protein